MTNPLCRRHASAEGNGKVRAAVVNIAAQWTAPRQEGKIHSSISQILGTICHADYSKRISQGPAPPQPAGLGAQTTDRDHRAVYAPLRPEPLRLAGPLDYFAANL